MSSLYTDPLNATAMSYVLLLLVEMCSVRKQSKLNVKEQKGTAILTIAFQNTSQ